MSCSGCCYRCYVGIVFMFVLGDVPVDVLNLVLISIAVVVPICFFGVVRLLKRAKPNTVRRGGSDRQPEDCLIISKSSSSGPYLPMWYFGSGSDG